MNIHTLGDLIQKSEAELLSYKNFGETSLAEIKRILAQKNFRLGEGKRDDHSHAILPDGEHAKILGEPVSVLELSSRSQRCMDRLGIETLSDLVKRSELELISQKNFGVTSLNEVKRKLNDRGLSLASG
jgi:DNA-directed RNA polymerase subunit alpha